MAMTGKKKPMNMIENPILPDIKKGPPRFVWSKKHWKADPGAVLRDIEPYTQFVENAVLAQSRDYNQTVYGKTSHREIVNAEFRPPLLNAYEDAGPLNRLPVKLEAIIPHINPGTAGHDGGTAGYTTRNQRPSDIQGALTDRIKSVGSRQTFYAPMDAPVDNSVLPDLETKLPPISVHAGWNFPVQIPPPSIPEDYNLEEKFHVPISTGFTTQVTMDGASGLENYEASDNRPLVSASSGIETTFSPDFETPVYDFDHNRPQVSVSAGMNTPVHIDAETSVMELFEKNDRAPIQVLNPGSENGYKERNDASFDMEEYIQVGRPVYSYAAPARYDYQDQNYLSHKPHLRERIIPERSYGQISQSSGAIPKRGIDQPMTFQKSRKRNPLAAPQKRKPVYRM